MVYVPNELLIASLLDIYVELEKKKILYSAIQ